MKEHTILDLYRLSCESANVVVLLFSLDSLQELSGARFLKVPIINGPVKLLLFTCKVEVLIVLHPT